MHRTPAAVLIAVLAAATAPAQDNPEPVNPGVPWPATDALGRRLPTPEEAGPPRPDRRVGIFYFLTHHGLTARPQGDGPYDVAKILAEDPLALEHRDSPLWGPIGMTHYWGEPLYGYYRNDDPWVLRRHAWLLADAGVDTLIFDTTNAVTYPEMYTALCNVFLEVRRSGGRTPQIAFMVNTDAGATARRIFDHLYKPGLFPELWFRRAGKPLMVCDPEKADDELKAFFTLRRAHWPFTLVNTDRAWHWEATYPQPYGYVDDPAKPEQLTVSVAQNLREQDGKVTNMSTGHARGRGFHDGANERTPAAIDRGPNFEEQWKRAFELQPPFVMVTGWNEWTAGRWGKAGGPIVFVDQFDREFSRDIEPMRGGHGDNYYWQLAANVRRFKGAPPLPEASPPMTIRPEDGFAAWKDVGPDFADHVGETLPRDHDGTGGTHHTDRTGRNDFAELKVARDAENLYFYARTVNPITPATDPNWMWLLLDTDRNAATGWEGYDCIVNRTPDAEGKIWIEKNEGGWTWKKAGEADLKVEGAELQLTVPRAALGLPAGPGPMTIDFKWADNLKHPGDVMDFYVSGDVAPEGRFAYRYSAD